MAYAALFYDNSILSGTKNASSCSCSSFVFYDNSILSGTKIRSFPGADRPFYDNSILFRY